MEKNDKKRVIFNLPENVTVVEVIDEILKNNDLEESVREFFEKDRKGEETRLLIVRDAAITLFEKKISEKKVIELLAKHLETSRQVAENIVTEIKQKLIPFAKTVSDEPPREEATKREVVEEKDEDREPLPYEKKIEVKSVEKNAEDLKKARTVLQAPKEENKGSDSYREPIK